MQRLKETIILVLSLLVLLYGVGWITGKYLENYPIFHFKKAVGSGNELSADKSLYAPAKYYAAVWIVNDAVTKKELKIRRISQKQLQQLRKGEMIQGYTSNGDDFYTWLDTAMISVLYLLGLGIGFVILCVIISLGMESFGLENRYAHFHKKYIKTARWKLFAIPILTVFMMVLTFDSLLLIINLGNKLNPVHKEVITAEIIGKKYHHAYSSDDTYYLDLSFQTASGETILIHKEVSAKTYRRNGFVDVAVSKNKPYDVFIHRLSISEIIDAIFSLRLTLLIIVFPILIVCYRIIWREGSRKQNKPGSNRQSKSSNKSKKRIKAYEKAQKRFKRSNGNGRK